MRQARGFIIAGAMAALLTGMPDAQARGTVELDAKDKVANTGGYDVRCGDVITEHTMLTHDLACPGTAPFALKVAGEGIVLDLGGYRVYRTGPENADSEGIVIEASSMVRNGTIQGFGLGYVVNHATNVRLHELALLDNRIGVYNRSSYVRFLITSSRFSGNGDGVNREFDASNGEFDIRSTVFSHNERAILTGSHNVDVLDSTFTSNGLAISCFGGRVRFRSSTLVENTAVGTMLLDFGGPNTCAEMRFENSLIANNIALAPPTAPVWETTRLAMINSWVVDNGSGLDASANTVYIDGNTLWDNGGGLTLSDLPEAVPTSLTGIVRNNRFLRNAGDGLRVLPPSTPTVISNVALGNTGWGIHAPTAYDGGGNVARDNGAGDCVGIICAPY
ncbi:right-handed parallel beta-helix repeat-containing protein [Corallococcus sp. CA053C]|uniref:right-handed parallel beta-helix repeat-containing protein n=1 Tax=Corallococcus sp. CA053C TaxID=2316732 RepID=UPI000EA38458|nr:right-handed parallel beta-helix repeat-containing protein [Corallococcus sp. CA053C]RKH10357.1 right-handed parallel beta-helix repeat-containing protein [Corallococcus sp. CA053C]